MTDTSDGKVRRWACDCYSLADHVNVVLASDHDALLAERDQEIERLKSLDDTAMRLVLCHDERDALRAENARLNERLDDALGDYMPVVTERDALLEALQRALADYETMRQERNALQSERDWRTRALAAMYEHHSMTHPNCEMDLEQYNIARAALALCERQQEGEHE
jgi:hypothetical protein